jgi:hypothetical protein
VTGQRWSDHGWDDYHAPTCRRLRRPEHATAARQLGKRALHPDCALLDVDVTVGFCELPLSA